MDHLSALAYLDAHADRGVKPGLDRIIGLLDLLAEPHRTAPIIHVAGTNGKTSTSRMAAAILGAHGLDAGLFTSPHLQRVEQRYEVGGRVMTPDEFAAALAEIAPIVDLYEERSGDLVTYFELTTALAFAWFAERSVQASVIETGLGGRLDASNAADGAVAVVTSVALDHMDYLGDTIAAIAAEKLAILDKGAILVTGELSDEALAVAGEVAPAAAGWFRWGAEYGIGDLHQSIRGWLVDVEGVFGAYEEIPLSAHGRHQVQNFTVAVAAVEGLLGRELDLDALRVAALELTLPGRMEVVRRSPLVMLDGAHNPGGAEALADALSEEFPTTRWHLVAGAMADKDVAGILEPLRGLVTGAAVSSARGTARALGPEAMASEAAALGVPVTTHETVEDALAAATETGDPVLVAGSLYVVGEARTALGIG